MESIAKNLQTIRQSIPENVTLVAVSKTKPISDLQEGYNAGQRIFGENKIQEMVSKYDALPKDIQWHMIGHLQRNKVKYMAHFVDLIHGVDTLKTLKEINKQAKKNNRTIKCLLQVKIAKEDTKFGFNFNEIEVLLSTVEFTELKNILDAIKSFAVDEDTILFNELFFIGVRIAQLQNKNIDWVFKTSFVKAILATSNLCCGL